MNITKLGHCCLVLEINPSTGSGQVVKIITDPGNFTTAQNDVEGVNIILITHEHADHFHVESVQAMLAKNPNATVVTNAAVGVLLLKEGIKSTCVGDGEQAEVMGVKIEGFGKDHAPIYGDMGRVENTAYMVADAFYFPGDNYHLPVQEAGVQKPVEVLALPVAGPWMKISDAIDFAKAVKAKMAFGVHDGMIVPEFRDFTGFVLEKFVPDTKYVSLADGETREFV